METKLTQKSTVEIIIRWIILLPASTIIGLLLTFPFHWILMLITWKLNNNEMIRFPEPLSSEPVERFLSPTIMSIGYMFGAFHIAPTFKKKAVNWMFLIYAAFTIILFFFQQEYFDFFVNNGAVEPQEMENAIKRQIERESKQGYQLPGIFGALGAWIYLSLKKQP